MFFLRRIIYIGESDGQAIYLDVKNPTVPLAAPKSNLLNTEASSHNRKYIILILFFLFAFGGVMQLFPATSFFKNRYSYGTAIYFIIVWLIECIGILALIEHALYKNVKFVQPTSKENFRQAVNNNLFWNNFSDKKITLGKKIFSWIFTLFMLVMGLMGPVMVMAILIFNMLGTPIGSEIIILSFIGVLTAVSIFLVWQNNMIRWFKAIEKCKNKKYKEN